MQQDLPAFLRWSPAFSGAIRDNKVEESRLYIHMDFTYQEFLLHRILWKRLGRKSDGLFESSCEVISTLLDIVTLMTKSGRSFQNLSWDVRFQSTSTPLHGLANDFFLGNVSYVTWVSLPQVY
jgi:chromatin structure-remodeling complex subunit RSC3/30